MDVDEASVRRNEAEPTRVQRRRLKKAEREYIWGQTAGCCYICREYLRPDSSWHVEHVLSFSSDPSKNDVLGNMLAACATCNLKKLDRPLLEVVQRFGCDLDSAAANASHLNEAARSCLLHAVEFKHDLYHTSCNSIPDDPSRVETTILDSIQRAIERAACCILPTDTITWNEEQRTTQGQFGEVFYAKWRRGGASPSEGEVEHDVALKFPKSSGDTPGVILLRELEMLHAVSQCGMHDHIVQFHGLFRREEEYGLVFEWCDLVLSSRLVAFRANLIELVAQTADALAWLHEQKILHRDVKPMNVLVHHIQEQKWQTAKAKLADFGLAKRMLKIDEEQTHSCGTGEFRAPEVRDGRYYPETDVFALGKSMELLKMAAISPLFKTNTPELNLWVRVQDACISLGYSYERRPKAAWVRDTIRGQTSVESEEELCAQLQAANLAEQDDTPGVDAEHQASATLSTETVYVSANARTGMKYKYHARAGCYKCWVSITLEEAKLCKYTECSKCH